MLSFRIKTPFWMRASCALIVTSACLGLSLSAQADSGDMLNGLSQLLKMGREPRVNCRSERTKRKKMSLEAIQKRDKEWMAATGLDEQMKALMKNAAANELNQLEATKPYFLKAFSWTIRVRMLP